MATFEAIVVGAGYLGCAIGYYLTQAGVKTVLIDQGDIAAGASRANYGNIQVQDAELEACLEGLLAEFPELSELSSTIEPSGDASWDLRERVSRLLVFALDNQAPAAAAVRARLRPLLTAQVLQDLGETGPMLQAFLESGSVGNTG